MALPGVSLSSTGVVMGSFEVLSDGDILERSGGRGADLIGGGPAVRRSPEKHSTGESMKEDSMASRPGWRSSHSPQ
jgi:hypothetical protein